MFNSLLERVLTAPDSPTADLYFRNACGQFLGEHVDQLGPTVFASETTCLVMRHHMRVGKLPPRRRLIYFIDDDVSAGIRDETLPFFYRQKLKLVEHLAGERLTRFAGVTVVGSPVLARLFSPVMETFQLRPFWSERFADLGHFEPLIAGEGWIEIAFLGSSIHRSDLQFFLPAVAHLLATNPRVRFHVPIRHRLPAKFDRHPRVCRILGQGWSAYRREIADRQFHICVYPLLETPFNRARSLNKLIEHAVVGSAPLYSGTWGEAKRVSHGLSGLCLPNEVDVWLREIEALIANPVRMRTLAEGAKEAAVRLNRAEPQRALWRDLMEIREAAVA
jgi:hypothetical protein